MAKPRFGLNSDHDAFTPSNLNRIREMGGDTVRIPFSYWWADFATVDQVLADCAKVNIRPIICLYVAGDVPPANDFATAAQAFVHRYPGVPTWQLLNEPNSSVFGGMTPGDAALYTTHAANAIREVNANVTILAPAPTPGVEGHRAYQRAMHQTIPNHLNIHPAIHYYPHGAQPIRQLVSEVNVAKQLGTGHVFVTEAGIQAGQYGNEQASLSAAALARATELHVNAMIFHCAIDGPEPDQWHQQAKLAVLERPKLYAALKNARSDLAD